MHYSRSTSVCTARDSIGFVSAEESRRHEGMFSAATVLLRQLRHTEPVTGDSSTALIFFTLHYSHTFISGAVHIGWARYSCLLVPSSGAAAAAAVKCFWACSPTLIDTYIRPPVLPRSIRRCHSPLSLLVIRSLHCPALWPFPLFIRLSHASHLLHHIPPTILSTSFIQIAPHPSDRPCSSRVVDCFTLCYSEASFP